MSEMRDGGAVDIESIKQARDEDQQDDHELLGVQAVVHPDGSDARIVLHTTQGSIPLSVSFDRIEAAYTEIRQAAMLMFYRQTEPNNSGPNPVNELCRTARRPKTVSVIVDRRTGDRLFVQQFPDHLPTVTRMSAETVNQMIDDITFLAAKTSN
ncbi:hypothetical protein [Allomesorhizobium alhagi]|uniref:Uncharacterized protein n=1 Tax=Mesorhizobium alhagi CCNWXJ12-2 TaxID=1107882 RepID=H0HQY2_9HYPH|nr:hypothetical protein [Mesorhizobium alhagi]EHK56844.1 hypothetical protein MAXJ12_12822 [Mesorhizobium alhagi CCNWXJ12-2]